MMKHLLSIEKDSKAEEIRLHGSPESLRMLAKKLWAIAEQAETSGHFSEQLTSHKGAEPELTTQLQGDPKTFSLVHTLGIHGHGD